MSNLEDSVLPNFFELIGNDGPPTRDVFNLRVSDLVSPQNRSHRRREPVILQGEAVKETTRQRLARESRELEIAIAALANQLAKRTEQLEHYQRFPEMDPFEDNTTLQFEKSFPGSLDTYSYVAHRAAGYWYLTGERSPQRLTWVQLVDWMGLGVSTVWHLNSGGRVGRKKVIG